MTDIAEPAVLTKSQIASLTMFGRANGARFDERGWRYYIRDDYDAFYPGCGDSGPTFTGSLRLTVEQASAASLELAPTALGYFNVM